ncbi:MAG: hypothetical protein H7177_06855 [Rhizobacter sp.]|nr:hypothetical protein [Bacteriovorax sp.]
MKKLFPKFLLALASLLILAIFMEASVRIFINEETYQSEYNLRKHFDHMLMSWYGTNFDTSNCLIDNKLKAHPHLAFITGPDENCQVPVTDVGTFGHRNLKSKKPADEFSILVLGGSQASQLAQLEEKSPLELALNANFKVNGKTHFKIYNGAHPAWKMPSPLIMKLMLEDKFDAFIVLDGFNEFISHMTHNDSFAPMSYIYQLSLPLGFNRYSLLTSVRRKTNKLLLKFPFLFNFRSLNVVQSKIIKLEQLHYFSMTVASPPEDDYFAAYARYINTLASEENKKNISHFLQPSTANGKKLTSAEQASCPTCNEVLRSANEDFSKKYDSLKGKSRVPVHNLTKIFNDHAEDIFLDAVHFSFDSAGNKILADSILQAIAADWKLVKKVK